ncbi:MAG: CRISPR-associated endonuclease Cas2 [Candidatus Moranbacteria bacterium RIFCSPHIGHO2_01_FULL_55_24]|nr:MAG: CRISPR-associated endonuclease Cas2 [Candidatus Moranbacteria bacterium RIFCSPHIGHO2_01_FULL_55_24]
MKGLGPIQKKILLVLLGGVALGFTQSPKQYFRIAGLMGKEWKNISKSKLERSIQSLYESRLVDMRLQKNGVWKMVLTEKGREKTLLYDLETLEIQKSAKWDKKWRIVIFDIPEKRKKLRNAFRSWLKRLEFYRLQDSVFVYPYDCRNELDFLVEFYGARKYVRFMEASHIDNEAHLKQIFSLGK